MSPNEWREIDSNAPIGPVPFPAMDPPGQLYRFQVQGITLEVPRGLLDANIWEALCLGRYETKELAGLTGIIHGADTVLELGAGLGFVSSFIARALRPARVVAVEADPVVARIARRTHALNGAEVTLLEGLVATEAGTAEFHRQPGFWGSGTTALPDSESIHLPTLSFAALLAEVRPQVLVLDVEGAECDLFAGVDLGGVRAISMELHRRLTGLAGIRDLFLALGAQGFAYEPTWSSGAVVVFHRA
jgi:FkbM family methyltransferase